MTETSTPQSLPPPVAILQMLTGKWVSQAISVAAELRLADHLHGGPKTPAELSTLANAHAQSLQRLLRALASNGIFAEREDGTFANTSLSDCLRAEAPGSMRDMSLFFGDHPTWDAWGELLYSVRTGKSACEKVHGLVWFPYLDKNPRAAAYFNGAMTGFSAQEVDAIHEAFDFSGVKTLVDIGGGHGALLCSSLAKNPAQRGILFDQPEVIAGAREAVAARGYAGRCELVGGSFFEQVPAADGYMLKHILHDWNDENVLRILGTIRKSAPKGARVFAMESIIQPGNKPDFSKLMDLEMLVLYDGGRERTEAEFAALFKSTGFELQRVVATKSPASVVEAVAV